MKFSIKDFFSKCDQIRSFLRIRSHLSKEPLMENFMFCAGKSPKKQICRIRNVENINSIKYRKALETLKTRMLIRIAVITKNRMNNHRVRIL